MQGKLVFGHFRDFINSFFSFFAQRCILSGMPKTWQSHVIFSRWKCWKYAGNRRFCSFSFDFFSYISCSIFIWLSSSRYVRSVRCLFSLSQYSKRSFIINSIAELNLCRFKITDTILCSEVITANFQPIGTECSCTENLPTGFGGFEERCRTKCPSQTQCTSAETCCGGNIL